MKPKMTPRTLVLAGSIVLLSMTTLELVLRRAYGFCDAVLYRADPEFEYIEVPQDRWRFGKRSFYNSLCQRNEEITPADSIVIDGFGDSVIDGGTRCDQDSLATTKLSHYLSGKYGVPAKVLNIAAGSWGPDNCYAYLRHYGNFHCKSIFLVVSSHDAFDDMTFEETVGVDPEHPAEQYTLAISELLHRYILPRLFHKSRPENLFINKRKKDTPFNSGFMAFQRYCDSARIPLLVYLHAERGERLEGRYDEQGQMIIDTCAKYRIPLVKDLDYPLPLSVYQDKIHFNEAGQERMFEILKERF